MAFVAFISLGCEIIEFFARQTIRIGIRIWFTVSFFDAIFKLWTIYLFFENILHFLFKSKFMYVTLCIYLLIFVCSVKGQCKCYDLKG